MIIGENYYQWEPNHLKYKDPENGRYSGSVIGNPPLEESLAVVEEEGEKQKQRIMERSTELIEEISGMSRTYIDFWSIVNDVETYMTEYLWPSAT